MSSWMSLNVGDQQVSHKGKDKWNFYAMLSILDSWLAGCLRSETLQEKVNFQKHQNCSYSMEKVLSDNGFQSLFKKKLWMFIIKKKLWMFWKVML